MSEEQGAVVDRVSDVSDWGRETADWSLDRAAEIVNLDTATEQMESFPVVVQSVWQSHPLPLVAVGAVLAVFVVFLYAFRRRRKLSQQKRIAKDAVKARDSAVANATVFEEKANQALLEREDAVSRLDSVKSEAAAQSEGLRRKVEELEKDFNSQAAELGESEVRFKDLESVLDSLRGNEQTQANEIIQLRSQLDSSESALRATKADNETLAAEKSRVDHHNNELIEMSSQRQQAATKYEQEAKELGSELIRIRDERDNLQGEVSSLRSLSASKESEVKELKETLAKWEASAPLIEELKRRHAVAVTPVAAPAQPSVAPSSYGYSREVEALRDAVTFGVQFSENTSEVAQRLAQALLPVVDKPIFGSDTKRIYEHLDKAGRDFAEGNKFAGRQRLETVRSLIG